MVPRNRHTDGAGNAEEKKRPEIQLRVTLPVTSANSNARKLFI
jgi:hypothetical protein